MAVNNGASHVGSWRQCSYCGWYGGAHDKHCPEPTPPGSPERKRWREGCDIGQTDEAGTKCPADPVAKLGYHRGQYMLEYSQNVRREDYYPD